MKSEAVTHANTSGPCDVGDRSWGQGEGGSSVGTYASKATRKAICWPFVKPSHGLVEVPRRRERPVTRDHVFPANRTRLSLFHRARASPLIVICQCAVARRVAAPSRGARRRPGG